MAMTCRPRPEHTIPDGDLQWLAGLFEGEGCVALGHTDTKHGRVPKLHFTIKMTDEDVVRRAHAVAGVGSVCGPTYPPSKPSHHKPTWAWQVVAREEAAWLADQLLPHLGRRRSARIRELTSLVASGRAEHEARRAAA